MKVYYWQGMRRTETTSTGIQRIPTREIVCARSKREARELNRRLIPITEIHASFTPEEINAASARPEVVLWRPLDARNPYTWTEVPKEST